MLADLIYLDLKRHHDDHFCYLYAQFNPLFYVPLEILYDKKAMRKIKTKVQKSSEKSVDLSKVF